MLMATRIGTKNFEPAKAFYDQIASLLAARPVVEREGLVGYKGPTGEIFLVGTPREGEATAGLTVDGGDISKAATPVVRKAGAPAGAVKLRTG